MSIPGMFSPTKAIKLFQASQVLFVTTTPRVLQANQEIDLDSTSIELKGAEISSIDLDQRCLRIQIARASLIKTLTGSTERTRWWQAGVLRMEDAVLLSPLPVGPLVCTGGDLDENIYTYRDMIPIPLASRGHIRCELHFEGEASPFIVTASTVKLEMLDTPKYLEHLRA
ncbi:hypothetical protein [Thiocystis minor]|uniref:hypothetical protein n=1 Tax=Thiocystis minor TaxID=61597 RepID=UPI0030B8B746